MKTIKLPTNAYCILSENLYDKLCADMKNLLGDGDEQILAERVISSREPQWKLPDELWISLAECSKDIKTDVLFELCIRVSDILSDIGGSFEDSRQMELFLSVPDESFIYFKRMNGILLIRLAANGYSLGNNKIVQFVRHGHPAFEKLRERIQIDEIPDVYGPPPEIYEPYDGKWDKFGEIGLLYGPPPKIYEIEDDDSNDPE